MLNAALENLYKVCWETRSARFNASRRLQRRAIASTFVIALASALLIFLSAITINNQYLNTAKIINIGGALVILVVSLWEFSRNSSVRADKLHSCGVELGEIYQKIKSMRCDDALDTASINALQAEYTSIIKKCSENHDDIDFYFHKINNPVDYPPITKIKILFITLWWHISYLDTAIYTLFFSILMVVIGCNLS